MLSGQSAFVLSLCLLLALSAAMRYRGSPLISDLGARRIDTSLGEAGEGPHRAHLLNTAVVDFLGSAGLAAVYAWVSRGSFVAWLIVVLLLGEVLHGAYAVPTATYVWLFGSPSAAAAS